jgi:hypothetical protein
MDNLLIDGLKWTAAACGIVAATMIALDLGRRVTGWGFAIFVGSNIAWIIGSVIQDDWALLSQNIVLLAIDVFGVHRYLIRKKPA